MPFVVLLQDNLSALCDHPVYCPPSLRVIVSAFLLCQTQITAESCKLNNSRQVKQNMAKDVFSHAFAQSATIKDRAAAALEKAYRKAASKDADPYGLLRTALRWGAAPAAAVPPVQKPMDAARTKVKALLAQPTQKNANTTNARDLVHGLLHKEQ